MSHQNTPLGRKHAASQAAAENILGRMGARLEQLDRWIEETPDDEHYITEVRFTMTPGDWAPVRGMLKADTSAGGQVAFHSGETVSETLMGIVNRLNNRSLNWKEDKPYAERKAD